MKVKVTRIPIRHNGKSYLEGEGFTISQEDYEKVKLHLEVIDEQEEDELAELRARAQELGVPRASQLGQKKLLEGIAEKEAAEKLKDVQEKATELGIEDVENKDIETLIAEIEKTANNE